MLTPPRLCVAAWLAALIVAGGRAPSQNTPSQAREPGAISGVVIDGTTGAPVAGARVSLGRTDAQTNLTQVVTDAKGRFVYRGLTPAGTYYLGASRFGYAYTRYGWTGPGQSLAIRDIRTIDVSPGRWVQDVTIPLWRLGVIAGQVVDERNEPVVGVAVRAYTSRVVAGHEVPVFGPLVVTDDRGAYRIDDLTPGRYLVGVLSVQSTALASTRDQAITAPVGALSPSGVGMGRPAHVAAPSVDVNGSHRLVITNFATPPPPGAAQARAYPAVFFSSATRWMDAQGIDIDYGTLRNGIDMQLTPVTAVQVSGQVAGVTDGTMPPLLLRLMPRGSESLGFGAEAATTPLASDGTFTFLNVPAGDYTLLAQSSVVDISVSSVHVRMVDAPGYAGGRTSVGGFDNSDLESLKRSGAPSRYWARQPVSVGNQPIDDLLLQLRLSATVSGRFVFDGETPPVDSHGIELTMEPANGDPALGQPTGTVPGNDPAFAFTITGLLGGVYRLTNSRFSYGIVSVTANGLNVTHTGFDGSLGQDFTDVVITATTKTIELSGTVTGSASDARADVIVFPTDRARWKDFGWRPTFLQMVRSGGDGAFTVTKLSAGEYFVIAVPSDAGRQWTDPTFLAAAAPEATRITLAWGDSKTINVPVKAVVVR